MRQVQCIRPPLSSLTFVGSYESRETTGNSQATPSRAADLNPRYTTLRISRYPCLEDRHTHLDVYSVVLSLDRSRERSKGVTPTPTNTDGVAISSPTRFNTCHLAEPARNRRNTRDPYLPIRVCYHWAMANQCAITCEAVRRYSDSAAILYVSRRFADMKACRGKRLLVSTGRILCHPVRGSLWTNDERCWAASRPQTFSCASHPTSVAAI